MNFRRVLAVAGGLAAGIGAGFLIVGMKQGKGVSYEAGGTMIGSVSQHLGWTVGGHVPAVPIVLPSTILGLGVGVLVAALIRDRP